MSAEAMFATGGVRVLDGDGKTVGFLWVEPAPGAVGEGGQLQRWVLTKPLATSFTTLNSYVLVSWETPPKDRAAWEVAVGKVAPGTDTWKDEPDVLKGWGDDPAKGLWLKGAFYVVAQSTVATPNKSGAMWLGPRYPRRAQVEAITTKALGAEKRPAVFAANSLLAANSPRAANSLRAAQSPRAGHPGHHGPKSFKAALDAPPTPQVVVPDVELHQSYKEMEPYVSVGIGGGCIDLASRVELPDGSTFFEGQEVFLLHEQYVRAGAGTVKTRIREKEESIRTFMEVRAYIETNNQEGERYEVTGCNYYQGSAPPPEEFR